MPRQRRSAPAPRQQTRSAHTAAAPAHHAPPQSYPSAHPASTSANSIQSTRFIWTNGFYRCWCSCWFHYWSYFGCWYHWVVWWFSSSAPVEAAPQQQQVAAYQQQQTQEQAKHCDADARNFTRCLEDNGGNMQICDYYLQQLKACQEASRQY